MRTEPYLPGLVGHWDFGQVRGNVVPDRSPGKHDGRIVTAGQDGCRIAKEGNRRFLFFPPGKELPGLLRAPPAESMVLVDSAASMDFRGGFTVSARIACHYGEWFPSTSAFACLVSKGPAYDSAWSIMVGRNGGLLVHLKSRGNPPQGNSLILPVKIGSRQDTALTVTYDGHDLRAYLDGTLAAAVRHSTVLPSSRHPLQIGHADGCSFCGKIFEVRLYNRPLTEQEVRDTTGPIAPAAAHTHNDGDLVLLKSKPTQYRHVETRKMPRLSSVSKDRGYVLFSRNHMELTFPHTVPEKDPGKISLKCFVPAGEYQPVSFCVRALKDIEGLSVELDRNADARMPVPESAVDIREVIILERRFNYCGKEHLPAPTYLEPAKSKPLARNTTRQFWLNIRMPEGSRVGLYRGVLVVKAQNAGTERIPLEIEVLPFKLAEAKDMNFGMYFHLPDSVPEEHRPDLLETFLDMRQHGMTSVGWSSHSGLTFSCRNGSVKVDFGGSQMERAFKAYIQAGFPAKILWLMHGDVPAFCNQFLPDERKFRQVYVSVIKQIIAYATRVGMPGIIFQPYDEPPSNPTCFPALVRELKCIKEAGGTTETDHLPLKSIRAGIQPWADQCVPDTDIFTLRYSSKPIWYVDEWAQLEKEFEKRGKTLFSYNINNAVTFPELATLRFCSGWFFRTAARKTRGQYIWAYGMGNNPYDDLDGDYAKFVQLFPPEKVTGREGGPAILWESYREGINDLRYIMTLEKHIRKAGKSSKQGREAQRLLDRLAASFNLKRARRECVYFESQWDRTRTQANGRVSVQGQLNVPNGWALKDYDRARRLIADAIIRLMGVGK